MRCRTLLCFCIWYVVFASRSKPEKLNKGRTKEDKRHTHTHTHTHTHRWLTSGGLASLEVGVIAGKQLPDQVIQRGIVGTKLRPGVDLVVDAVTSLSSLRVDVEIALQALRLKQGKCSSGV